METYIWILIWLHTCTGKTFKQYTMDQMCGSQISMTTEDIYGADITMTVTSRIQAANSCNITLESRRDMPYLHFEFSELSLPSCTDSDLLISTGSQLSTFKPFPDLSTLCGLSARNNIGDSYTSTDKYMFLQFNWKNGIESRGATFRLIVNSYRQDAGTCRKGDEYKCNNDRCIHSDLTCKGHNPCGDQSDCPTDSSDDFTFTWWPIPIMVSVVFCCFVSFKKLKECLKKTCSCLSDTCSCICESTGRCVQGCRRCVGWTGGRCVAGTRSGRQRISSCTSGIRDRCSRIHAPWAGRLPCICRCSCYIASTNTEETNTQETTTTAETSTETVDYTTVNEHDPPPYHISMSEPPAYRDIVGDYPPDYIVHFSAIPAQDSSEPPPSYSMVMAT